MIYLETQSVPELAPAFQAIRRHLFLGRWIGLPSAIHNKSKMISVIFPGFSYGNFLSSTFTKGCIMDLNILLLNIGRGALRPPEGR